MPPTVRGETVLEVDGKKYRVKFTWADLELVETELGRPLGVLARELRLAGVDARTCLCFARAGLATHHSDLTRREVAALFDRLGARGRDELIRIARTGFELAFPEMEEGSPPGPPPPASI